VDVTPAGPADSAASLRAQISNLLSLFPLSMMMFDRVNEGEILDLMVSSVPSLCSCDAEAAFLVREDELVPISLGPRGDAADLAEQVARLAGLDGEVTLPDCPWAWAFALSGIGGRAGYLVVAAASEPPMDERFLLKVLVQQVGAALASARLHLRDRQNAMELGSLNQQLTASVADLESRTRTQEVLARVSVSGEGEEGIARALHELTGLPVAIEDRFGNLRAWAGPGRPEPYPKAERRSRSQLLRQAGSCARPVRDGDRLIAVAQPRGDILGVVALVDPDRGAGPRKLFALEHAALTLSVELAHLRGLAEMQLRMRRDLVDDLISGGSDGSAVVRAGVLGHDLQRPHWVVVAHWRGATADSVARAVERTAADLEMGSLLGRRSSTVVLLAHSLERWRGRDQWGELHRAVGRELRSSTGSMGVGDRAEVPADIPRSFEQATQALAIRRASRDPDGVTVFDDLGVYRILATRQDSREVELYVREWLGALLDYDAAHRSELVATLSEYVDSGGSYDRTAQALLIHRSTLRYRLQRIRDITGRDINEVETRFNLQVALRAWRVIGGAG
jgi:sugar diacid utilization regulator